MSHEKISSLISLLVGISILVASAFSSIRCLEWRRAYKAMGQKAVLYLPGGIGDRRNPAVCVIHFEKSVLDLSSAVLISL
jgi:hypothetical protein